MKCGKLLGEFRGSITWEDNSTASFPVRVEDGIHVDQVDKRSTPLDETQESCSQTGIMTGSSRDNPRKIRNCKIKGRKVDKYKAHAVEEDCKQNLFWQLQTVKVKEAKSEPTF